MYKLLFAGNRNITESYGNNNSLSVLNGIMSYFPFFTISVGLVGNTACFFVFRFNKELKKMSSMVYLSYLVIVDTFAILIWNLDLYTYTQHHFYIENLNLFACRLLSFIQYSSLHSSSFLLTFLAIDRFVVVKQMPGSKICLPFATTRTAHRWSISIILFFCLLNLHTLFLNGIEIDLKQNQTLDLNQTIVIFNEQKVCCYFYSLGNEFRHFWNMIHLCFYSLIPFCVMSIFNFLLIKTILDSKKKCKKVEPKQHRVTVLLLVITWLFLFMTLPSIILTVFFSNIVNELYYGYTLTLFAANLAYLNHSTIFFEVFIFHSKFRKIIKDSLKSVFVGKSSSTKI